LPKPRAPIPLIGSSRSAANYYLDRFFGTS
jgi:hypothetical protein